MTKNVFELNAPDTRKGRGIRRRTDGGAGFVGDVGRIPELHQEHRGQKAVGPEMKRAIHQARELLASGSLCVACPAGQLVNIADRPAVRCGIERSFVTLQESPTSLLAYCTRSSTEPGGGYAACPTWLNEKARRVTAPLVGPNEGT